MQHTQPEVRKQQRFDFECFKKFIVRLARKLHLEPAQLCHKHFLPLQTLEGRQVRKDYLHNLLDLLGAQCMLDFMTVLLMCLHPDIYMSYARD